MGWCSAWTGHAAARGCELGGATIVDFLVFLVRGNPEPGEDGMAVVLFKEK